MGLFFNKLFRYVLVVFFLYSATNYYLRIKSYDISPKQFKAIAAKLTETKSITGAKNVVASFNSGFIHTYSALVSQNPEWHAFPLGTHHLQIFPLYLSLTEYAAIIGTSYPSIGRIGLHWSNSTCTVLTGSVSRQQDSGKFEERQEFPVGTNFRHGQFESHVYSFSQDTYVACYGRGLVPFSGIWSATSAIANGEPVAAGKLFMAFFQTTYDRLALSLHKTFHYYKNKATGKQEL